MKLSIMIDDCCIISVREGENSDLSKLIVRSGEDTAFSYNGWEVKVHVNIQVGDGDIIVKHTPSESFSKKIQKRYRLVDGTITIDEAVTHPVHFSRASISAILSEHFGITELVRKDINGTSISATWDPSGYSGTVSLAYMLSDGQCAYSFASNDVPLAEMPEDMMLQRGEIKLTASQSSWTVLCKYSKTDRAFNNDFTRECVLYTTKPNLFLLARELEAYLESSSYGRFEDCLEEFILE